MNPPRTLFGFPARWNADVSPREVGACDIAGFHVRAHRWELRDVAVEGLKLGSEGHIVSFSIEARDKACTLFQQDSAFYQEEGAPRLSYLKKNLAQGDGISSPRWHKVDRQWPVDDRVPFRFLGQGYIGPTVVYLFAHPTAQRIAIFTDDVKRQDAEEYYAEEEKRG